MKPQITIIFVLFFMLSKSQNSVGYQYDANGNRTQRTFVGLRMSPDLPGKDSSKVEERNKEIAMKYGLSIYPNPTRDVVNISINKADETSQESIRNATIYLMDNSGKEITRQKYDGKENLFDLSGRAAGVYYLRIAFNKQEDVSYKVIKVN